MPRFATLDIETLGLTMHSLVMQIGYVIAEHDGSTPGRILKSQSIDLDLEYQQVRLLRSFDPETLDWWRQQSVATQRLVLPGEFADRESWEPEVAFSKIKSDFDAYTVASVWAGPASFDFGILTSLFGKKPWHYKDERCYTTLHCAFDQLGGFVPETPDLIPHVAMHDALAMARHILAMADEYCEVECALVRRP